MIKYDMGKDRITITIDDRNRIFIGSRQYTTSSLAQVLEALASNFRGDLVAIRADKTSDAGVMLQVIDMISTAGVRHRVAPAQQEGRVIG